MSRPCSVCQHPRRQAIDAALVSGGSLRDVAGQFAMPKSNVARHVPHLQTPTRLPQQASADVDILAELRGRLERADRLVGIAEGLVGRAAQREDWRTAVAGVSAATRALGESRACLDLLARLLGEVPNETPTVNVNLHAEWPVLRQNIVLALEPYPDARQAVLVSLNGHAHS